MSDDDRKKDVADELRKTSRECETLELWALQNGVAFEGSPHGLLWAHADHRLGRISVRLTQLAEMVECADD